MNQGSPGGLNPSYESRTVNYTDDKRHLNLILSLGFGPLDQPDEATDEEVRAAIEAAESEPVEATDEQVREIFSDRDEHGRTARPVAAIGTEPKITDIQNVCVRSDIDKSYNGGRR